MTSMNDKKFVFSSLKYMIITMLIITSYSSTKSYAADIVKLSVMENSNSINARYKEEVILEALKVTEKNYGSYEITFFPNIANNKRGIVEVNSGKNINTYIALTTNDWEENTIPIRIPIRLGISNYRLLTINKKFIERFNNINSLDDLKKLRVGLQSGWAITTLFKEAGFNVIESNTFNGLFYMLDRDRVDFIPRGINEAFPEIANRKNKIPSLMVHPELAFTLPSPFYVFVSPTEPRLAERLTQGITEIYNNGTLKKLFEQYYAGIIKQANINERTMFIMENDLLPKDTPKNLNHFWFYNSLSY